MLVLVTVGSTKFDALVETVLSDAVLKALYARGYTEMIVQCGNSQTSDVPKDSLHNWTLHRQRIAIELWRFKPTLQEEYERADLVISHAGELLELHQGQITYG